MAIIDINGLNFGYDGAENNVFENLTVRLDTDWRTGLVGRNGRGKTTLLKLLSGRLGDFAAIKMPRSLPLRLFPLNLSDSGETAAELCLRAAPQVKEWKLLRELSLLGCDCSLAYRPFATLSGGEKVKLQLAALFAGEEDSFALIDEPTDHLDEQGRRALARYLAGKRGFLLASHDRALLDGCVDHVLSLNRSDARVRRGDFSSCYAELQAEIKSTAERDEALKKEIARLKEAASQTAGWAMKAEKGKHVRNSGLRPDRGRVGAKAAAVMKLAKNTERRLNEAASRKQALINNAQPIPQLRFTPRSLLKGRLLSVKDLSVSVNGKILFKGLNLELDAGDRAAVTGVNGCGKSTLLSLLSGRHLPSGFTVGGTVELRGGLKVAEAVQDISVVSGRLKDYAACRNVDLTALMTLLNKLGTYFLCAESDAAEMSLGQKKKLTLAAALLAGADLLIWDEPLNFLDIEARMQIESLLKESGATIVFVEHDAAFVSAVATKTINL